MVPIPMLPLFDWKMFELPIRLGLRNLGMKLVVPLPNTGGPTCPKAVTTIATEITSKPSVFDMMPLFDL